MGTQQPNSTCAYVAVLVMGRFLNKKQNTYVLYFMGAVLVFSSIFNPLRSFFIGDWNTATDLPLHLCGISGVICAVLPFLKRKQALFRFCFLYWNYRRRNVYVDPSNE